MVINNSFILQWCHSTSSDRTWTWEFPIAFTTIYYFATCCLVGKQVSQASMTNFTIILPNKTVTSCIVDKGYEWGADYLALGY